MFRRSQLITHGMVLHSLIPARGIWQAGHRGRAGIGHALATVATQLLLD
jgi:hypothetical protein